MAEEKLEEFLNETIEDSQEYDEDEAKAEGKQVDEEAKASGKIEKAVMPENTERAARAKETVADFTQDDELPMPKIPDKTEMILVSDFGGRFQVWAFDNLQVIQGFAQNLQGKKRLFRKVEGKSELQEINALGDIIKR